MWYWASHMALMCSSVSMRISISLANLSLAVPSWLTSAFWIRHRRQGQLPRWRIKTKETLQQKLEFRKHRIYLLTFSCSQRSKWRLMERSGGWLYCNTWRQCHADMLLRIHHLRWYSIGHAEVHDCNVQKKRLVLYRQHVYWQSQQSHQEARN